MGNGQPDSATSLTRNSSPGDKAGTVEIHSPHESHKVLPVLRKKSWITPVVFGGLVAWLIGFLILGSVDIDAKGNGILITPEAVVPFQSLATGQIGKWYVKVGDYLKKGDLLAVVDQPLIEKELSQALQQLEDIRDRNSVVKGLSGTNVRLERETLQRRRRMLLDRIGVLGQQNVQSKTLSEANSAENLRSLDQQRKNLEGLLELERKRLEDVKQDLDRTEELRAQRLRSADEVVSARQSYGDQVQRVLDLELQLTQLGLSRIRADESNMQSLNRIKDQEDAVADLNEQLEELESQETQLQRIEADLNASQFLQQQELARQVEQLRKQLQENREIRSEHDGRVLELTTGEGQLVTRGQRLGTIDTGKEALRLQAVAYFKVQDGKRIHPGTVLLITPATVTRERFGSVMAKVTSVGEFPVSAEGAAKIIGNTTLARTLTNDGYQIEVRAELEPDPSSPSGYKWDLSAGPEMKLSSGTIATVLGTIESRAPITFIFPNLRY